MTQLLEPMASERKCLDCGTPLPAEESQPVCPRCIFLRFAKTGSTIHPPETAATLAPSEPAGRDFHAEYELLGEIGRGGMGVIYKAHQPRLNRVVAIKVIHAAQVAGEAARRRFEAEMQMAGRLNHPNIVPVFDTGVMDGCPCFSMEFFPGGTLAARMREFATKPENGVRLLVKVARAVSFAHQRGVLHRDLKPANILLDEIGEPHVADFGLAKQLDSDSDVTRSGAVLGSPNYMSPEQAAGKSDSLTVATDIYSLGVMLYEILTGRTPFVANTPLETMRLVVEKEAQRPSTIVAKVNRDLETVCLKCLRKEPEQRYRTAEELADDLERWLRHEPIQARPVTGMERFQKWVRRHPALAAMSALFLVAILSGAIGILWQWRQAEEARRRETQQLRRAEAALARSAVALAESALREGNSPAVQSALASVPPQFRDATWDYLQGEADTSRPLPDIGVKWLHDIAAHPGRPSVFAAADRQRGCIVVFNVRDGRRLLEFVPGFTTSISNVTLYVTIAGDRIAVGRGGRGGIAVHNVNDGRKLMEWEAPFSEAIELSPDGSLLMQVGLNGTTLNVWNARYGTLRWSRTNGFYAARFTSDGQHLASFSWGSQLHLLRSGDGAKVADLSNNYFAQMATQPGGPLIVAANSLGFVRGFDVNDGRQRFEFQPHESKIEYVAFLPGGERFLTAATLPDDRMALQCWDAASGRACQTLMGGSGKIDDICLHPLSGELIVNSRDKRVWETISVPPLRVIRGGNAHPSAVFWGSRDVLFTPGKGLTSANLQSISNDIPAVLWRAPTQDHGQPSVSADGRRAALGRYDSGHAVAVVQQEDDGSISQIASIGPRGIFDYVRLSPDGDRVAIVHQKFAGIQVTDVANGRKSVGLDVRDIKRFSDLVWLDGGKRLAGLVTTDAPRAAPGSVEQIVLWDTATGQRVHHVTNQSVLSVACAAPDGRRFVEAGADRNVRLRDGATLEVLREFRVHNAPITALAWHPARPILATASEDLAIRLWNLETGVRLEELRGPLSPPSVLSFSPDGTRLATASRDRAARIWEPRSLAPQTAQK